MDAQRGSQMVRVALFIAIPLVFLAAVALFISYRAGRNAPIDTTQWTSYSDPAYGFSLQYPSDWDLAQTSSENQDVLASYIITDTVRTAPDGRPLPLAQIDISGRGYIQLIDRVRADAHASHGEEVTVDGVQGSRFRSAPGTAVPLDATLFPLGEKTIVIYTWPDISDENYTQTLSLVVSSLKLQ